MGPSKIDKLRSILGLLSEDTVSKDDALHMVKMLIKHVKTYKTELAEIADPKPLNEALVELKKIKSEILSDKQVRALAAVKLTERRLKGEIELVRSEIPTIPKIPEIPPPTDLTPVWEALEAIRGTVPAQMFAEDIRNYLELLEGEERLSISAIRGLEEALEALYRQVNDTVPFYVGTGGRGTVRVYDLSSSLDGVTKTFNLPALNYVIMVQSTSSPIAFRPTIDYTYTDTTITFTDEIDAAATLASGQTLLVIYAEI